MNPRQQKAASAFGFTTIGAGICLVVTFFAANSGSDLSAESSIANIAAPSQTAKQPTTPKVTPASVASSLDPASIEKGKENYNMFCLACHGAEDAGIDSPSNLFDPKWYHGSGRDGIELSIRNGIMEKGMPGWGAMIASEDITALVDYLISFQTTNISTDE